MFSHLLLNGPVVGPLLQLVVRNSEANESPIYVIDLGVGNEGYVGVAVARVNAHLVVGQLQSFFLDITNEQLVKLLFDLLQLSHWWDLERA